MASIHRGLAVLLLFAAGGCRTAAAPPPSTAVLAPPSDPMLAAVADPAAPGHDEALEKWEELSWEVRCDRLRAGLRSMQPRVALYAAEELGPEFLSLEEIRWQMSILVHRPEALLAKQGSKSSFRCAGGYAFGSPDLVPLLEALVLRGGVSASAHALDDLHRVAVQDHIPNLYALLRRARGPVRDRIHWMIRLLADNTDRNRGAAAHALLFARACRVAEFEGRPEPRLEDVSIKPRVAWWEDTSIGPKKEETAVEFLARYEALLHGLDPSGWNEQFPETWLARWKAGRSGSAQAARVEAFTETQARERAAELAAAPIPDDGEAWGETLRLLPLIEVAAPEALDELLRRWREAAKGRDLAEIESLQGKRARAPDPAAEAEAILLRLERGEEPGIDLPRIGRLGARARPLLEKYRRERHHGLYWEATAGLAIAGDAAARAEFLAFLRDDRAFVLDGLRDFVGTTLDGDREALEHFLSRVGSNCCLWFHAWERLRHWYPTMPAENAAGDYEGRERLTRAWWEKWKDRLKWSRLADGWVPTAE